MNDFNAEILPGSREVTITRRFNASPEVIWEMYTNPEHLVRFYGSPGCTHPVCEIDLRVGGVWNHTLRVPNGQEFPSKSTFTVIEKPHRLEYEWEAVASEAYGDFLPPPMKNVYEFVADGDGCRLTITVTAASPEARDGLVGSGFLQSIEASMGRLDEYIDQQPK